MAKKSAPRATPAQVRGDIQQGLSGDKKPGFDPAAAPLETDAEAAGAPMDGRMAEDTVIDQFRPDRSDWAGSNADAMRSFHEVAKPRRMSALVTTALVLAAFATIVLITLWLA